MGNEKEAKVLHFCRDAGNVALKEPTKTGSWALWYRVWFIPQRLTASGEGRGGATQAVSLTVFSHFFLTPSLTK